MIAMEITAETKTRKPQAQLCVYELRIICRRLVR
jgi:hypothetical protein